MSMAQCKRPAMLGPGWLPLDGSDVERTAQLGLLGCEPRY